MKNKFMTIVLSVSIIGIGTIASAPAISAANEGVKDKDPAQWNTEDTTPQARYQTAKREAGAAYQEALAACKQMRGSERASCTKEAAANFRADMAEAKKLLSR